MNEADIIKAVETGVANAMKEHPCYFSSEQRKDLHEFADAIQDEGANRETHIIVLRIGINVQRFVKRAAVGIVWGLIIVGIIAFLILIGALPKFWPFK